MWYEDMMAPDCWVGEGKKEGSNERDILIQRPITDLEWKLVLGKFPEIHKDDPS